MRSEKAEAITIFWIEPADEKQAVFDQLERCRGKSKSLVVVLPNEPTRAFLSPRDFHDLKLLKRVWDVQIVFVIPKQGRAQWARSNNFPVAASLETVVKHEPGKAGWSPLSSTQLEAASHANGTTAPRRSASLTKLLEREEQRPDPFAAHAPAAPEPPWSLSGPVTPQSEFNEGWLEEEGAPHSFSQALRQDPTSPRPPWQAAPAMPTGESPWSVPNPVTRLPRVNSEAFFGKPAAKLPSTQSLHPHPPTPKPGRQWEKRRKPLLLTVLALVLLSAAVSAGLLFAQRDAAIVLTSPAHAPTTTLAGHLYFLSSGQINEMGTTGINDVVAMTLSRLTPPAAEKSYYVWLRSDIKRSDAADIFLGRLQVSAGKGQLTYSDPHHSNLLMSMSQVLVTEEDSAGVEPVAPSPDRSTWRYLGLIPQMPAPQDTQNHFSYLDHLRHLLAAEPTIEQLGLHGGLVLWLEKNTRKVSEWATAAQDESDPDLIHQDLLQILEYLDGIAGVGGDVPAGSPILVDAAQGQVGLLQMHAEQTIPSYLQHIGIHLSSLIVSPGVSADQRRLAQQLMVAMDSINACFAQARQDAQQLVMLSNQQLLQAQAHTLLNYLATETNEAYAGVPNPYFGSVLHGVDWLHSAIQNLAVIDISAYQS